MKEYFTSVLLKLLAQSIHDQKKQTEALASFWKDFKAI